MLMLRRAREMAEATPASRNRAADGYRAAAILVVVLGHWLVAAPHLVEGRLQASRMLSVSPWTQYLTWAFQVMPAFFLVGGFSNAASWTSARRDPVRRRQWLGGRMRRLLAPILPLVLFWAVAAAAWHAAGLDPALARIASQAGLIPVWFLAVYVLVTAAVPVSFAMWERAGGWSVLALAAGAVAVDAVAFAAGAEWLRWANYGFIWLAVHQIGYWWHRGDAGRPVQAGLIAAGAVGLWLTVGLLGYPVSMISVPGAPVSNSAPPTAALLALAFAQAGLLLALAPRFARWLAHPGRWAGVILVNARIMSLYLWHTTAMVALVGLALAAGGVGLTADPGSAPWWLTRPVWLVAVAAILAALVAVVGRVESDARTDGARAPSGPLPSVLGALAACWGLSMLALQGASANGATGINLVPVAAVLAGGLLAVRRRG